MPTSSTSPTLAPLRTVVARQIHPTPPSLPHQALKYYHEPPSPLLHQQHETALQTFMSHLRAEKSAEHGELDARLLHARKEGGALEEKPTVVVFQKVTSSAENTQTGSSAKAAIPVNNGKLAEIVQDTIKNAERAGLEMGDFVGVAVCEEVWEA